MSSEKRRLRVLCQHVTAAPLWERVPKTAEYASSCYFPSSCYVKVPVLSVRQETYDSKILTFGLPSATSLALPVSACLMMQASDQTAKPYNPITSNRQLGSFSLLIKQYENGTVSNFAGQLKVGDLVPFCHFKGNVKSFQYPFGKQKITMVCTGTGITPMYQALLPLLETSGDTTEIRLIFGNKSLSDIMLGKHLSQMEAMSGGRFTIYHVLGRSASDNSSSRDHGWKGETGWIDADKIKRFAFPPSCRDSIVWLCGTKEFYDCMAGSRHDEMTDDSILASLGYKGEQVWRS
mgnify:CR=1 FL=1|jgi:cytochrome-b5 reductase